jgi:hypothetical protein
MSTVCFSAAIAVIELIAWAKTWGVMITDNLNGVGSINLWFTRHNTPYIASYTCEAGVDEYRIETLDQASQVVLLTRLGIEMEDVVKQLQLKTELEHASSN